MLQHPEIALHTNGSENDVRACVTLKTCRKLGVSVFRSLGDRLRVLGADTVRFCGETTLALVSRDYSP